MKNKHILFFIAILVFSNLFFSCYNDLSTEADNPIESVIIDTTGFGYANSLIEVPQGTVLSLSPKVSQDGVATPDFSYEWRLALTSSVFNDEFVVISTEKNLNEVISRRPSNEPYYLWYVVKDKTSGLDYSISWKLMVVSSAGDGLIVADTRDGQNSNVSFIKASCFSSGYTNPVLIKRNAYSAINGEPMKGLIKKLLYSKVQLSQVVNFRVYALTDNNIVALDPETYELTKNVSNLFMSNPLSVAPKTIVNGTNDMFFVNGDDIYTIYQGNSASVDMFGASINFVKPGSTTLKKVPNEYFTAFASSENYPTATFYDKTQGCFMSVSGFANTWSLSVVQPNIDAVNAYDPAALVGLVPVGSGPVTGLKHLHILKNPTTKEVAFYTIENIYEESTGMKVRSVSRFATSSCPEISNAIEFETCENRDVVYYATTSSVFSAFISGSSVTGNNRFTPPTGEVVTGIKLFREAWYLMNSGDNTKTPMPENSNQLLVSTYNSASGEGKIYALPITNLTGSLGATTSENTFGGFGRIISMCTQGK